MKLPQSGTLLGVDAAAYGWLTAQAAKAQPVLFVARDHAHVYQLAREATFFAPKLNIVTIPAWDVQPYDRLPPDVAIQAARVAAVGAIPTADVVIATVNGLSTRLPAAVGQGLVLQAGTTIAHEKLANLLVELGYTRTGTVTEPGEFAIRGAVVDIFLPDGDAPVRLDFFDDTLESLKTFDPLSQRSGEAVAILTLAAATELVLTPTRITNFRNGYRSLFPQGVADTLYTKISEGHMHPLALHYLPLFEEKQLPSVWDILPKDTLVIAPPTFKNALQARQESIADAYETRLKLLAQTGKKRDTAEAFQEPYRPLPPEQLYLTEGDFITAKKRLHWLSLTDFDSGDDSAHTLEIPAHHLGANLPQRIAGALELVAKAAKTQQKIICTAATPAGINQLERTLSEHSGAALNRLHFEVSPVVHGFTAGDKVYLTEQDVFGDRQQVTTSRKRKDAAAVIAHFSDLQAGDFVVHDDHGVARFDGLVTLDIAPGQRQDFLKLVYAGEDRVYVPVEALNLISRFSAAESGAVALDKLGGAAWQARKAKVKRDLLAMAGELMRTAAARHLLEKTALPEPAGVYADFAQTFPYTPTGEQQAAIDGVLDDMAATHPMDRLVVGDVGFGKTEVALRAACIAAGNGKQVAVVCPTTLLARQHFDVFSRRFAGFPFKVGHLSRLVTAAESKRVKEGLASGEVSIVIGTHALLAKDIAFNDLGLLVIDEEQRFGVAHKEKLKALRANVDVLTLTATPIPRTLHMALGGLKELSNITTPPVDRLAVRSYVLDWDSKVLREAILREVHRGGQVFVVTPQIADMAKLAESLHTLVPEATFRTAHGQMPERELEDVMNAFYANEFHVLVSTSIVESGIDVPRANTLIVHRADRFGLSQLHQLRGRVGRSTLRAYAYFLLPQGNMTELAERRLRILQRLDYLGAGFQLANFDMDLRGAGNLLGKEQSGHLNDVGFELYTKMLQDAVEELTAQKEGLTTRVGRFTPQLNIGLTYLIPENYVPDLPTRMQLYRRLADLEDNTQLADFAAELRERFGELPAEADRLLHVVSIRNRCKLLNIDKLDAGGKGAVIRFYQNTFAEPAKLMTFIQKNAGAITVNRDQTLTFHRPWGDKAEIRLKGMELILDGLDTL
ncbi:MAG: transcription-repair coupling factor [Alphaproteobacteria bacterium]